MAPVSQPPPRNNAPLCSRRKGNKTVHGQPIRGLSPIAHPDGPLLPHDLWMAWNIEPSIVIPLLLSILIYVWGMHNLWQRAGTGRGITSRQWISFLSAIVALVIAYVSPLD